jgi:uncharacterized protein (TIGR03437 family)
MGGTCYPSGGFYVKTSLRLVNYLVIAVLALSAGVGSASAQVTLAANPTSLSFAAQPGGPSMALPLTVTATSTLTFAAIATTTSGGGWLTVSSGAPQTPTTIFVQASPGSLGAGTYTGSVMIVALGAANSPLVVPVTMTIGLVSGQLSVTPASLSFSYTAGGALPVAQNLLVSSTTIAQVIFTATASTSTGGNWLSVSPAGGITPANISAAADPTGLAPAVYSGTITLTPTSGGGSFQVAVTLTVSGTPQLAASPGSLTFRYQIGQAAPAQRTVSLSSGGISVSFAATSSGGSWLVVTPASGATPSDLTVGVSPAVLATLPANTYSGSITIFAPQPSNSPLVVPITLLVSTTPFLTVTPDPPLSFTMPPGGALPANQNLSVGSTSTGTALPFTVTASTTTGANWLSANPVGGTTPATVAVSVGTAATALLPGTYSGTIAITPTTVGISPVFVSVTLTVSNVPSLVLDPPSMVFFNYQIGKGQPATQTVEVKSTGVPAPFTTQVSTTTGGAWLLISPTSGATQATVSVWVNPVGLAAGKYEGSVTFTPTGAGAASQVLQVTLNVSNTALMNVSPGTLSFDFVLGATATKTPTVSLTSTGDPLNFTLTWTMASGGSSWLAVMQNAGTTPANLTVVVYAASLAVGTYTGSITVTATGANSQTIPVTARVTSGGNLSASPTSLAFSQPVGGAAPPAQTVALSTSGTSVRFTATPSTTTGVNWLAVNPPTDSTPANLSVSVDTSLIAQPGTYYGSITIQSPEAANSPITIAVTFTVGPSLTITLSPASLQFSYQTGSSAPAAQKVAVNSSGVSLNFTAAANTQSGGAWLSVTPAAGSTPGELNVSVSPSSLSAATYNGTVTVTSASASNSPQTVSVTLTVTQPEPVLAGVANAASYARGTLAVGEIVYLEGTNIGPPTLTTLRVTGGRVDTVLANTRILFDGTAAPLIYVSSTKSSAVVPYALAGRASTRIQVEYQSVRSSALEFRLADSAPGIFSLDASGLGQGAVLNQDYSVNGPANPAPKGSVVMVYATGEGQLFPPVLDGSIGPGVPPFPMAVLPVSVSIGGRPAQVFYAGQAPNFVSGVLQVNARIPDDAPSGAAVPIVITVGSANSQAGLTLAVR